MAQVASEPVLTTPESIGPEAGGEPTQGVIGRSPWQLFWRRFRRDKVALAGLIFIGILVVLALGAPLIATLVGHGPNQNFVHTALSPIGVPEGPSGEFLFGADGAGRDLFVRVIYGTRTSLIVAFLATGISLVIGVTLGLISGYYRGKLDTFISRVIDIVLSLPILLLAIGLAAACGASREGCLGGLIRPGILLVSYIVGLFNWPYLARIVRGQV
ncbi:MAG TPA: ABC transporter permease, partial [Actinomycetota bacterium]|nr:ABC transporter permease [Actinomycetota bacterium]